jgi:ubiquinone/menaquinone biosynthesis C-methylase UbiE
MRGVKRYYDAIAPIIDDIYQTNMRKAETKVLKKYLEGGWTLDIGCGSGMHMNTIASKGVAVGIDISPKLASIAKERSSMPIVVGEAMHLPFKSSTFDSAIAVFGALNHVKSLKKTIRDIARIIKPGGLFVLTVANKWNARWYLGIMRKGQIRCLRTAIRKREGMLRRSVDNEWIEVWTRFYSLEEIKSAVSEYFEVKRAFGLSKNGKIYGSPISYLTEYIGLVLRVRN